MEEEALLDKQSRPYLSHTVLNGNLDSTFKEAKKSKSLFDISSRPTVMESTGFLNMKVLTANSFDDPLKGAVQPCSSYFRMFFILDL